MKKITIQEVAKMSGVSVSTVSRVLNQKSNVSESTREVVQECIAKHAYYPSETARNLVKQSSKMIGVLVPDIRFTHDTDITYYIEQELSDNGYSCIIINTGNNDAEKVAKIQFLRQRQVDAVILIGAVYQSEAVRNAITSFMPNVPVIITNGDLRLQNTYSILIDEKQGIKDCVSLLLEKGRREVAFLYSNDFPDTKRKLEGFLESTETDAVVLKRHVVRCGHTVGAAYTAIHELMCQNPTVDSIIFQEDVLAVAGMNALKDLGKHIPEDVAIIGVNNSLYSKLTRPLLTTLDNKTDDLCRLAVRNLLDVLNGKQALNKIMIFPEIIDRKST